MSTKNLPPVATAGGPPSARGDTVLHVPTEAAVFDQEFLDNHDLNVEGGNEYTLGQKMVQYCGGIITQSYCIACKFCLAFFAGAATSKMLTTTKPLKEASCLQLTLVPLTPSTTRISTWTPRFSFVTPSRRRMNP